MNGSRRCSMCKKVKSLEDFPRAKHQPEGRGYYCRICQRRYNEAYRKAKPEHHQIKDEGWYIRQRARMKVYQAAHPEVVRAAVNRRRARRLAGRVEPYIIAEVCERDSWTCQICMVYVGPEAPFHIDHIVPLHKGGSDTKDNVRFTHPLCNQSRTDY